MRRLRVAAALTARPLNGIITEAVTAWLDTNQRQEVDAVLAADNPPTQPANLVDRPRNLLFKEPTDA